MKLAERFGIPVVTLVDTKGAYPGIGAEERGQGIALAENIRDLSALKVPVVACIIGEGGSGGALALAVGNRILMLEFAYYSVISPEGCASILWRDGDRKQDAAAVLKLTAADLLSRGFIDEVVKEPLGGAHRDPQQMAQSLRQAIIRHLDALTGKSPEELANERYEKFRVFGDYLIGQTLPADENFPPAEIIISPDDTPEPTE
jgi:acetyl-CoA carboxylase carboxyl transferase subunit alpha